MKSILVTTNGFFFGSGCNNQVKTQSNGNFNSSTYIPKGSSFYYHQIGEQNCWIYDMMNKDRRIGSCIIYEKEFDKYKKYFSI